MMLKVFFRAVCVKQTVAVDQHRRACLITEHFTFWATSLNTLSAVSIGILFAFYARQHVVFSGVNAS